MPQMTFAQIGTLYNAISNQLEGGVTPQNQQVLLHQVATVQTQLQGLVNNGTFNGFTDPATGNPTIVHAQNIADQMSFLSQQISTFGQAAATPQHGKFINDVVRDVQDIVAGDANLTGLAQQNGHMGFQQVSNLLTPPAPFPDSGTQTATLNQFVMDSTNLSNMASKAIADPHFDPNSAATQHLIGQIQTFTAGANAYVNNPNQAGVFSARFQNEFATHGVQGTASADLIKGLQNHDAQLVNGAATVLKANAADVTGNMLQTGQNFTPVANFGIPAKVADVHTSGMVFDDAVTKLIGGVDSVNKAGVAADLTAVQSGFQNTIAQGGIPATELAHLKQLVSLVGHEGNLVNGINTANPTPVSQVNTMIHNDTANILNIVNNDPNLHNAAGGTFIPLPPDGMSHGPNVVADASSNMGHNGHAATPAIPAIPAIPAVPGVTHATPAVHAVPAVPADHGNVHMVGPADLAHHVAAGSAPAPAPIPPMPVPPAPQPVSQPAMSLHDLMNTNHHTVQIIPHIHDHLV